MSTGSTWRGLVLLGGSVLVAVALSTATVAAAPQTTPVSGPPTTSPDARTSPTVPGALPPLSPSLSIDPSAGPVATEISYEGACGARVRLGSAVAWGVSFSPDSGAVAPPHLNFIGSGAGFDREAYPSGPATFHGAGPVPANLIDGTAVTPGLYYVNAGCLCAALATCPGGGVATGAGPGVFLPPQPFCVTSPHPVFVQRVCLDNSGWLSWLAGNLGAGRFLAAQVIGFMSDPSIMPFATLGPSPPPTSTTTTVPRRNGGAATTAPTTEPPTAPPTEPPTVAPTAPPTVPCDPKVPPYCPK